MKKNFISNNNKSKKCFALLTNYMNKNLIILVLSKLTKNNNKYISITSLIINLKKLC